MWLRLTQIRRHLFSYEEDSDSVLINALNTYLDTTLSGNRLL
jgi:hypothetical protein